MFTGIVSGFASIKSVKDEGSFWAISVDLGGFKEGLEIGASVSLDGVCLTVVSIDGNIVHFDIIEETLNRTTLGKIKAGNKGGRSGQWSARKAQMLAKQYKDKGGGYR